MLIIYLERIWIVGVCFRLVTLSVVGLYVLVTADGLLTPVFVAFLRASSQHPITSAQSRAVFLCPTAAWPAVS